MKVEDRRTAGICHFRNLRVGEIFENVDGDHRFYLKSDATHAIDLVNQSPIGMIDETRVAKVNAKLVIESF